MLEKIRATFWSTPKRKTITTYTSVTVIFALLSWFYVGSALFTCGGMNIATGGPGDGTAGLTWLSWIDKGGPIPGFTHLTNAPFGETLRDPFQITSLFNITGMWLFSSLTGSSICAWNIMIFIGYMSSALAMFAFIRWLLKNNWIAFFAAIAVTFTPFHQMNAQGHLSYMFNFFFILAVWAFLVFWRNPSKRNILLLGTAAAACVYEDGYFILLGGVLMTALIVGAFLIDKFFFKKDLGYLLARIKGTLGFLAIFILFLAPVALVQLKFASQITSTLASSRGDIMSEATVYSARPLEYLLPADNHPLLPASYSTWRQDNLHGSNFTESTLFIGFSVFALAILAWVLMVKRGLTRTKIQGLPLAFIIGVVSFALLCAFLVSLQPVITVFGHKLPLPSWFLVHLTANWRVLARLVLIVDMCAVILAAIGLYYLVKDWRPRKQTLVIVGVTIFALIELLTQSRAVVYNYNDSPAVYNWLKTQNNVKSIAEFPIGEQPSWQAITYFTYQQVHGKALFNSSRSDSPERPLRMSILGLNDPQTLPILRTLGIDMVLSHEQPANNSELQFVRYDVSKNGKDKVWTYRILPGEKADYALMLSEGFHLPEVKKQHSVIDMGTHGILQFKALDDKAAKNTNDVHVSLSAVATKEAPKGQLVTFTQQGKVLWQGTLDEKTAITFDADPSLVIDVIPYKGQTNTTIQISDLKVTAE